MKNFYFFIFNTLYGWALKRQKNDPSNHYAAFYSIAFLVFMNFVTIYLILNYFFSFSIDSIHYSKGLIIVIIAILSLPQYFLLIHNKKYLKIKVKYEDKNKSDAIRGSILTWLYIIFSFALFFGTLFYL